MLPPLLDKTADSPRDRILWGVILTLLVTQLIAFWMLCSHQVKKAEAREAALQMERMALADCMQSPQRGALNGCANRVAPQVTAAAPAEPAVGRVHPIPVSLSVN